MDIMKKIGSVPSRSFAARRPERTSSARLQSFAHLLGNSAAAAIALRYCKFAIRLSSACFGGRVRLSGNVASGSSTTFS